MEFNFGRQVFQGDIDLVKAPELTIASGVISPVGKGPVLSVDTEADAGSDFLDTITAPSTDDARLIWLRPANTARSVVLNHAAGNILCPGAADITLAETTDYAALLWSDGDSKWVVVGSNVLAPEGGGLGKYIPIELADPGTGAAIPVTRSATIGITTAASETNTLAIPTFIGQCLILYVDVYAVGDRVVTVAAPFNVANNTIMTFGAVSEACELKAVNVAGSLVWQMTWNDTVSLS